VTATRELGAGLRVLIIGINYRPEVTGIGPYTAGLAEHLAARGDDVTVITGLPHYPAWRIARGTPRAVVRRETIRGVTVIRAAHNEAKAAAKPGPQGASVSGLLADKRLPGGETACAS
jgi:hypothetical protein